MMEVARGDIVRLEAYGGEKITRRVVELKQDQHVVLVCKDDEFQEAQAEGREPIAVGFPLDCLLESVVDART